MSADDVAPTLADALAALERGEVTPCTLAERALARIRATEPTIRAFAHLDEARALRCADAAPSRGSLHGVGIGVKDIIDTADLPTEIGTAIHAGRRPARDAACVQRLVEAGGYVLGKTVSTAFAFMDPGVTRNPWQPAHTPGGSSSGSAAAVAAGQISAAIGTQTNGSVIRPAAFCGVVGFKPTLGAIDFTGAHVFSATLDTLGTFTRTVADAATLAGALAPHAVAAKPASLVEPPRLAFLASFPWAKMDPGAAESLTEAAVRLRGAGATVTPVGFPDAWRDAHRVHRTIMLYEGARSLSAIQSAHRARLSAGTNAALDEGHAIDEADYRAALAARATAIAYFAEWLAPYDAVLSPPANGGAPHGLESTGDPGCSTLWSLTGFPAIALPTGFDAAGLPLGVQLAAPAKADDTLLRVATWCEARLGFGARVAEVTRGRG